MNPLRSRYWLAAALTALLPSTLPAQGKDSFARVADEVNKKCVKLFGAGGYQGLAAYGTGVLVSKDGYILTVASQMLDTQNLRVHLYDGRRYEQVKVVVIEPALDVALLKIEKLEKGEELPYYDIGKIAKTRPAQTGDWILAFSNQFEIATRDEPMSVQRGVIAAQSKLQAHKGIFQAPYTGDVYIIDAITNNPGAGGGVITTRKGDLVGIIGKELRNTLTDTWINYAVPIQSLADFVDKAMKGTYRVKERPDKLTGGKAPFTGIILVPNVVERTPPFVEEIIPGSPAAKAGLRPDDLIVYVEGQQVGSIKAFRDLINQYLPGTALTLEVRRVDKEGTADAASGKLVSVKLTLAEPPAPKVPPKKK